MKKLFRIFVCIGLVLAALSQSFYAVPMDTGSLSQLPKDVMKTLRLSEADISGLCAREEQTFFVADQKTVFCYNQVNKTAMPVFESDEPIAYYVPYAGRGVMLGAAPLDENGQPYETPVYKEGLTWNGQYTYYEFVTGKTYLVENPDRFLLSATVNAVSKPNFKTTINGKAIPHSKYPPGSIYDDNDWSGGECHGFGLYIFNYLFGTTNVPETWHRVTSTASSIKSICQNLPLGSLIRTSNESVTSEKGHSMILVGKDANGITVYHANYSAIKNQVNIDYYTWSEFASSFKYFRYTFQPCTHSYSAWTSYSSTQHKRTCTECGKVQYGSHYGTTAGLGRCVVCKYYGTLPGPVGIMPPPSVVDCCPEHFDHS